MKFWLKFATSIGVLVLALALLDWEAIRSSLVKLSPLGLVASLIVTLANFAILACRWHLIVQSVSSRTLRGHLTRYLFATYLNSFTPANLGGDIYRFASLRANSDRGRAILVALLRERFLGLLAYLLAYSVLLLVVVTETAHSENFPPMLVHAGMATTAVAVILLATSSLFARLRPALVRRTFGAALGILEPAASLRPWGQFALLLFLTSCGLGVWIAAVMVIALDLQLAIPWPILGLVVVLTELIRLVPITIQGIGLREATFAYLLGLVGGSAESGFVLGAVAYAVLTCSFLVCGLIGWTLLQCERRA